ncbi:MAG TPA: low temperature requirement protein A, partial [Solirubrobacterales bacterium]|nr:low temperature requirement protein A [Solirubrobacterales bacterium]
GLLRGVLVLASIWWAWAAYAWLTNEIDSRRWPVRLAIFGAMIAMLIASLAVPGAFEDDAMLFACAYLGVRLMHIGLFAAASEHVDVRQAARALALTATLAPVLLIVAAQLEETAQTVLWIVVLAIDYAGGGLRGIGGWRLSPGHFAERHSLIVIIALGESIVAIGVGAEGIELRAGELIAAALGVVIAAGMWWTYFDDALEQVERRLQALPEGLARNVVARDAFSFLHLPLVVGIVLLALGVKKTLEHVDEPLKLIAAVGLCGGVALYLAADVAFRRRCLGVLETQRLLAAAACLALLPVATELAALVAVAGIAAICAVLVAYEAARA